MQIYNFDQYSPEWWAIRERRMTASKAQAIGNCGEGLETYIDEMMSEYYSTAPKKEHFESEDTKRGNELEPVAAMVHSMDNNVELMQVGFVVYDDFVGCSPDRFQGKKGLCEIKCPNDKNYYLLLKYKKIDPKYLWQMQMQMLICEKEYCDYVVYNPNFKQYLYVDRVYPDPKKFESLQKGFEIGKKLILEADERMAA